MPNSPSTKTVRLAIPDGLRFADLKLARDPITGDLEFEWTPIERLCEANGLDLAVFRDQHEDNVGALLVAWYAAARENGEPPDLVEEQILAEVQAEEALGEHNVQRGPGRLQ